MTLLEVKDLSISAPDGSQLISEANWEIAEGARLGIIGESGSGKSLTALAIMGLLPKTLRVTGQIYYDGQEITSLNPTRRRAIAGSQIGMVFQEPLTALDPLMRAGEQIAGPLRLQQGLSRKASRVEALRLAEEVNLTDPERILNSYPWQLSGGQRQRVALAMVMACRPRLLLADEPTTALDVTVQAHILELLDRLVSATDTALVFISHDLAVVSRLTSEIVVMQSGRVVEKTTMDQALSGQGAEYTKQLVTAAQKLALPPELRPELPPVSQKPGSASAASASEGNPHD